MAKSSKVKLFNRDVIPKTIRVMGVKIKIRIKNEIILDGSECFGLFLPDVMEIHLLRDQPDIWNTLYHELLHSCLQISGNAEGLTYQKEEALVIAITSGMFPFIR